MAAMLTLEKMRFISPETGFISVVINMYRLPPFKQRKPYPFFFGKGFAESPDPIEFSFLVMSPPYSVLLLFCKETQ